MNYNHFVKKLTSRKSTPFYIEAIDETAYIRSWSAGDRMAIGAFWNDNKDNPNKLPELNSRVVILSLVDEHGKNLFTLDDMDIVSGIEAKLLDLIAAECLKVNGFGGDGEAAKNSNGEKSE